MININSYITEKLVINRNVKSYSCTDIDEFAKSHNFKVNSEKEDKFTVFNVDAKLITELKHNYWPSTQAMIHDTLFNAFDDFCHKELNISTGIPSLSRMGNIVEFCVHPPGQYGTAKSLFVIIIDFGQNVIKFCYKDDDEYLMYTLKCIEFLLNYKYEKK